ncbi:MAG: PHP domain-containing protein [Oligoflexia bacterium]|nr:PHP domain-containing protein [Oligoflexia bacterium]
MRYAELQCRTHYSFLRGASHPEELVERAAELGLAGIAITDLDGVYGIPKAYAAAKRFPQLKLIVGSELTVLHPTLPKAGWGLGLLALDRAGYGLLCRLITASRADKPKGEAGLGWEELLTLLGRPESRGLVAIPRVSLEEEIPKGFYAELKPFFPERLFLPVSRFLDGLDAARVAGSVRLARELGLPLLATNDVHYHAPERRALQDALTATRHLCPLEESGRRLFSNGERYLKAPARMAELFADFPEALENTARIAELCRFSPSELRYRYPSEWIPRGETAQSHLASLTWEGAGRRYAGEVPPDVRRQLEHELRLVEELGFADYFLTIWEIVEFARSRDILCQGRGSAANSAICYCLGITAVDPVRMRLLFERFLSAERGEPPDIDVDFEHERREEVIQHVYEKYGRDRAGMVSAIITYRTKSVKRDLAKALGLGPEEVPEESGKSALFAKLAEELKGFPRHLSIHSGGFTLSADPLIETVPIEPARMEGRTIVQWDKEDLAVIGLLKVDLLALGMLSALHKTLDLVNARPKAGKTGHASPAALADEAAPGRKLTLATIPAEDARTYEMIRRADTVGVFQIESRAQMSMLPRLLPRTFYDLVVQVAIVRPGPIVGQMVHPFLRRRRGEEPIHYPHPALEPILGRTLGVPLFQEQVMKIAIVLAGFTPGEADELRRAIGAWRSTGSIEKMGRRLMDGLLACGLPLEWVERVFLQIQGFAEYGFPESHAASFALLAYASSYLKCHYPAEFACALLNSQPMGFYSPHTIIEDARRHGVRVLPVDPNRSDWDCTLGKDGLRVGLRVVRGFGEAAARRLIAERERRPFASLGDFFARARLGFEVLQNLALGGAFSGFGFTQREALWELLACHAPQGDQLELFADAGRAGAGAGAAAEAAFPRLDEYQAIQAEYRSYGLSTRGHPMGALRRILRGRIPPATTLAARKEALRHENGRGFRLAGLVIVRQRPPTAKGTVFATLEDDAGFLDLILHRDTYERYGEVFNDAPFVIVSGNLQRDGEAINLIVRRAERLDLSVLGELTVSSRDYH